MMMYLITKERPGTESFRKDSFGKWKKRFIFQSLAEKLNEVQLSYVGGKGFTNW